MDGVEGVGVMLTLDSSAERACSRSSSLERLRHGDEVHRLAPLEQLQHRAEDAPVGLPVEVLRAQEFRDLDDRLAVDQDRAEHRLLGLEAMGR